MVEKQSAKEAVLVKILRIWGTIIVIAVTAVAFSFASPYFLTFSNFNNILFSMIVPCLVSIGLTYVVVVGSFDLSVGLIVTFTSIICASLIPEFGMWLAMLGALFAAFIIGLVNGLLVTFGRLSGIVVTLAMMFVLGGLNIYMTGGYQIAVSPTEKLFRYIGQGRIQLTDDRSMAIAVPVIILAIIFFIHLIVSSKTRVGYYIRAVGDNAMAVCHEQR